MDEPSKIYPMEPLITSPSKKIAILAVLTSAALSTNYLLIGLSNIKLMDLLVFTSGYLFGYSFGVSLGILVWLIYGILNPYGFSLPILAACITGEILYGLFGGFISQKLRIGVDRWSPDIRLGLIGFLLTFIYDLFTNVISALTVGIPVQVALITGIPFSIIHEVSNAIFFAFGLPPLVNGITRLLRRSG